MVLFSKMANLEGAAWAELAEDLDHPVIPGLGKLVTSYLTNLKQAKKLAKASGRDEREVHVAEIAGSASGLSTTNLTRFLAKKLGESERRFHRGELLRIYFTTYGMPRRGIGIDYQTVPRGEGGIIDTPLRVKVVDSPANNIQVGDFQWMSPVDVSGVDGIITALRADADIACEANLEKYKA